MAPTTYTPSYAPVHDFLSRSSSDAFLARREAETPPVSYVPQHGVSTATAVLAALLGALVATGICLTLYRYCGLRREKQRRQSLESALWATSDDVFAAKSLNSVSKDTSPYSFVVSAHPVQSGIDTNPNWVPQTKATPAWLRPLSVVYKQSYDPPTRRPSYFESTRVDAAAPIAAKTHVSRPSVASEHDVHLPITSDSIISIAAPKSVIPDATLSPAPPAYIPGNRTPPAPVTPAPAKAPITPPTTPPRSSPRAQVRTSVPAAITSTPVVMSPVREGEEGQELDIPDFPENRGVPVTPRFSSLPKDSGIKSSAFSVKNFFPPTPPLPSAASPTKSRPVTILSKTARVPSMLPLPRLVTVVGTFQPNLADELHVIMGETLRLLEVYGDDWCLVQRLYPTKGNRKTMTMETGAVPILCLAEMEMNVTPPVPSASPTVSETMGSETSHSAGSTKTGLTVDSKQTSHWSSATTAIIAPISPPLPSASETNSDSDSSASLAGLLASPTFSATSSSSSAVTTSTAATSVISSATVPTEMKVKDARRSMHGRSRSRSGSVSSSSSGGQKRPIAGALHQHQRSGSYTKVFDVTRMVS